MFENCDWRCLTVAFSAGSAFGAGVMWGYFLRVRLIRTRREWYADPVIKAKYGDDPNPQE
jgi:hypothetical protein